MYDPRRFITTRGRLFRPEKRRPVPRGRDGTAETTREAGGGPAGRAATGQSPRASRTYIGAGEPTERRASCIAFMFVPAPCFAS